MNTNLKKSLKIISLVIVMFCLAIIIINTSIFDEKLRPEVVAILKEPVIPPIEGNAYFAILGLMETYGQNITETGYKVFQYQLKNNKTNVNSYKLTDLQYREFFKENSTEDLIWNSPVIVCDKVYKYDCLSKEFDGFFVPGDKSKLNNGRLKLLLSRYKNIISMKTFKNYPNNYLVPYNQLRKLGEIQLINKYKNYSSTDFINQLYKDITFWKMLLIQGTSLIDKMGALANIRRDVLHLSEFIRTKDVNPDDLLIINKILQPIHAQDIDLSTTFELEARFMYINAYEAVKHSSIFETLLFQPNATNNYHYEVNVKPQKKLSQLPLNQFIQKRKSKLPTKPPSMLSFHYLYNPIGKMLTNYAGAAAGDYISRAYDTITMIKLVKIQIQAKRSSEKNIANILSKPKNQNPYTGKPFIYNKIEKFLKFDCLDESQECYVRL